MSAIPTRIQRIRHIKGWRKPEGVVDCTRAGKWGNDYAVIESDYRWSIVYIPTGEESPLLFQTKREAAAYAVEMFASEQLPALDVSELAGKTLMCWCAEGDPCHADSILRKANAK